MPGEQATRVLVCERPSGRLSMALSADERYACEQVRTLAEHVPDDGAWTVEYRPLREGS